MRSQSNQNQKWDHPVDPGPIQDQFEELVSELTMTRLRQLRDIVEHLNETHRHHWARDALPNPNISQIRNQFEILLNQYDFGLTLREGSIVINMAVQKYRQSSYITAAPTAEEPKKFNIVFYDPENDDIKIYGFPLCLFCKHNKIYLGFSANAEAEDLFTICKNADSENATVFNDRFYFDALKDIFDPHIDRYYIDNKHLGCRLFEPELRLWQEGHAVKAGEFELV